MSNGGDRSRENPRKKALIISISDYTDLRPLPFCKKDGQAMFELLKSKGYEIVDDHKLIGEVAKRDMEHAIDTFFTDSNLQRKDLLFAYFSGHGIPEGNGEHYIASSEIDPDAPWRGGYSFDELARMLDRSKSERKVLVLDCCFSGAATLGKGTENDQVVLGKEAISTKIKPGYGKCLLAACQGGQESFDRAEGDYSLFTYYVLQALRGNERSVDKNGNVTPETLSNYVIDKIWSLPFDRRPKQDPIRRVEAAGDIILASYPSLAVSGGSQVKAVDLGKLVMMHNQGPDVGGEVYAAITAMETSLAWQGKRLPLSARYAFEKVKTIERTPDYAGVSIGTVEYVLQEFGAPPESAWPYEPGLRSLPHGTTWEKLDSLAAENRVRMYRLDSYQQIPMHLLKGRPVLSPANVYEEWYAKRLREIPYPSDESRPRGAHLIAIVGFNPKNSSIRFANSWGKKWGVGGFCSMSERVALRTLWLDEMFAIEVPASTA